tara:strand:- start:888 stop:1631 length:744 start_codon:yes stop_codon:yes gene_type:complete
MQQLLQAGKPGLFSGFDETTGKFKTPFGLSDKPYKPQPQFKKITTGLSVEGFIAPPENIRIIKNMGLGSFVKKIVKAPTKVVTSVAKGAKNLGTSAIDAGTSVVKGTGVVAKDIYSGTKKATGSVGRGIEKIGAGFTTGASGILSDPVSLVGVATGNPALILGGQAVKTLGSSGAFVDPLTGQVVSTSPSGQPFVIQQPMGLPGYQPIPFQQPFRSGNDDQSAFDLTSLLPIAIGGLGLFILLRGRR